MSSVITKLLKIDGMHCSSCALNIDMDLVDIDGVESSETNYAKQVSKVTFDGEKVSIPEIIASIKKTGYNATVAK